MNPFVKIAAATTLFLLCGHGATGILTAAEPAADHASGWSEDFSHGMKDWWAEGGQRVWVEEGRLHMAAEAPDVPGGGACTVWCRRELPDDFELEIDAHVVSSSIDANNMNLFLCYADPTGKPLEESRDRRRSAAYNLYHQLNGYIITRVNEDGRARARLRRNPGFRLLAESYLGQCRRSVTYHLKVRKTGGEIVYSVDGKERARATDPSPHNGGLFGLRTYRTKLWWDNVRVRDLSDGEKEGTTRAATEGDPYSSLAKCDSAPGSGRAEWSAYSGMASLFGNDGH